MEVHRQHGRSLLEMLVVVAIIGLVAAIAVPSSNSMHLHRLSLATTRVADAFRFARDESRRTGVSHGISVDVTSNGIRVFQLDEAPNPNDTVFNVRHPLTKQFYAVQFSEPAYVGVELSSYGGQVVGSCTNPGDIAFDATGVVRCTEPTTTRFVNASVELTAGASTQSVMIDGYTGRVIVQ